MLLHYYGDLTLRETAVRMGVSEGTVKAALHDARGRHAIAIALGVLLVGRGEVFMADFGIETVGEDVPTTNLYETRPEGPLNLEFSEAAEGAGSDR